MPLHSALAKLPARLLSWLRFLPRSWISVYILCVVVQGAWVVISLISIKIWLFIRSGRGKDEKKHVRKLKNCFTQYDSKIFYLI